jgi:hypothetical protein
MVPQAPRKVFEPDGLASWLHFHPQDEAKPVLTSQDTRYLLTLLLTSLQGKEEDWASMGFRFAWEDRIPKSLIAEA